MAMEAVRAVHYPEKKTGEILIELGFLKEEELREALEEQKTKGGKIGSILKKKGFITESQLKRALSLQANLKFLERIDVDKIDRELISRVPISFARKFSIIPLWEEKGKIILATSEPFETDAVDYLSTIFSKPVKVVLTGEDEIIRITNIVYGQEISSKEDVVEELSNGESMEIEEPRDLLETTDEAPVIKFVNSLFFRAVKENSSDIHIEVFESDFSVRFRVDGVLHEVYRLPKRLHSSITSRVKVMAGMDIAEKRLPQDGRIRLKLAGKDIDIRVSTIPTTFGERVVMRLLDRSSVLMGLEDIGLSGERLNILKKLIRKPHGIVLVTGPTGSGKTTTLYACLSKINTEDKNIITIEDPVEYQLKGIGQIHVNPKIGLTFASGLRAILRQDPDVIMVGEIRDHETAEIAIHASLTGHLVLSTLHTNDAPGAITRLIDMGIEPFLVASSLVAVIAQRLVRVICPHCKKEYTPEKWELKEIGIGEEGVKLYKGTGCDFCFKTGYKGRTGIFELLLVDDDIRNLITKGVDSSTIKKKAVEKGMLTLRDDGARKVLSGITTVEEVLRVTQEDFI